MTIRSMAANHAQAGLDLKKLSEIAVTVAVAVISPYSTVIHVVISPRRAVYSCSTVDGVGSTSGVEASSGDKGGESAMWGLCVHEPSRHRLWPPPLEARSLAHDPRDT